MSRADFVHKFFGRKLRISRRPKPKSPVPPPPKPRYGTVDAAGPFAGRGGWFSYGGDAAGQNLQAALPFLDWVAFKYPLDGWTKEQSAAFVSGLDLKGRRVIAWEQDTVVGLEAAAKYLAQGWIGVGENELAFENVRDISVGMAKHGFPVALGTTFVPETWPSWAVGMFELYYGDGKPIKDNTPLEQMMALGAPAVVPIAGGFGGYSLEEWFGNFDGQGFPGTSAWTIDAFPPENVDLLAKLPYGP